MPETTTLSTAAAMAAFIQACAEQTEKYVGNCPEDKRLCQVAEGKATPLWLLGHMANTTDMLGNVIGLGFEPTVPPNYRELFLPTEFGGKAPTANAADYPSWDELAEAYKKVMSRYAEGIAALADEDIPGPPKGELPPSLKDMVPTIQSGIILNTIHDSHHRGQMGLLAKS